MAVIVGISDKHMVMAELDNMNFKRVKDLAFLTMKRFRLKGFIILKSSPKNYHVVFDKPMRYWSSVLKVIGWMGIVGKNPNLRKCMLCKPLKNIAL